MVGVVVVDAGVVVGTGVVVRVVVGGGFIPNMSYVTKRSAPAGGLVVEYPSVVRSSSTTNRPAISVP